LSGLSCFLKTAFRRCCSVLARRQRKSCIRSTSPFQSTGRN